MSRLHFTDTQNPVGKMLSGELTTDCLNEPGAKHVKCEMTSYAKKARPCSLLVTVPKFRITPL